ncbi:MAG: hypothetical protein UW41_C0029G0001 [Candidatus Collierbacteria bacterium GW2011_GWC2_44_18]|uniref:Uncharacterized protein n=1 Tax=Candidatus Collierbacteria bacterium GW2011_GWC2_44_18 TaxID=1618392 RepID=A0A0G1KKG3_9BACT|nr:MAG: hypothetical protein UW41_C0029G0001 [Candidatus Collierbacteria bacterium GW2011_GWC2_44_18]
MTQKVKSVTPADDSTEKEHDGHNVGMVISRVNKDGVTLCTYFCYTCNEYVDETNEFPKPEEVKFRSF